MYVDKQWKSSTSTVGDMVGQQGTWLRGRGQGFSKGPIEGASIFGSVGHDRNMSKALPVQSFPAVRQATTFDSPRSQLQTIYIICK